MFGVFTSIPYLLLVGSLVFGFDVIYYTHAIYTCNIDAFTFAYKELATI